MWIELANTLPAFYPNASLHICSVLESLANASFHGRHVLYGSRQTLQWFLQHQLSAPAKAAISRTLSTLAERGSARESVSTKLMIEPGEGKISKDINGHFHAPIESLINVPIHTSELLAENLRDAFALKLAAAHYKKLNKLNSFHIAVTSQNGGGAGIHACFTNVIQGRERFTLTVTDSDKDHPAATACSVSRDCEKAARDAQWICQHYELPCREIENLLPYNLLEDSIRDMPDSAELVDPLNKLTVIFQQKPDALKYADLKEGTKGSLAITLEKNQDRRTYWKDVAVQTNRKHEVCAEACKAEPCACRITPGLGAKVLQRFLDHCQLISIGKQVERVNTSPQKQEWLDAGKTVFHWSLADHPMRV